jgi:hypothetical protein
LNLDVIGIAESHLSATTKLDIPGYKWFGQNREKIHPRAKCGSGGVGILVKLFLLEHYDVHILDRSLEGALWVQFKAKSTAGSFNLCVCYLPPERSSRAVNAQDFYDELLKQVHNYQNMAPFIICGDFNSRTGCKQDIVEGVDEVCERHSVDNKCNAHGQCLLEFLLSAGCCMLNGRSVVNDFTCVSSNGMSVVDYCIVPHEHLHTVKNFCIRRARYVYDNAGDVGEEDPSRAIPDHSMLTWYIELLGTHPSKSHPATSSRTIFDLSTIDTAFFDSTEGKKLLDNINSQLDVLDSEEQLHSCYSQFCQDVKCYMLKTIPHRTVKDSGVNKKPRRGRKPWWTNELSRLWNRLSLAEKAWAKAAEFEKAVRKTTFNERRREFDGAVQAAKRIFWYNQQEKLLHQNSNNPKEFWRNIGNLGIAQERANSIPMEVVNDGKVISDIYNVLFKWKNDFEHLLNSGASDTGILPAFTPPCTAWDNASNMNSAISIEEVQAAIRSLKTGKASGADEIPAEIWKNNHITRFVHSLVNCCFRLGCIPDLWRLSIIHPIPKGATMDPRDPLSYRGISLTSSAYKLYCAILSNRLNKWCDFNNIIFDEQNGFRKDRSCLDHLSTFYLIGDSRLKQKRQTYVAFIDFSKAYDNIPLAYLWHKLHAYGIHDKMLYALKSLYYNVESCVRINGLKTEFFKVNCGLKQGCLLSPLLFNIYVNDLCHDLKMLSSGIKIGNDMVNTLLYADDLLLLAETEVELQNMLNVLHVWCHKWKMKINNDKSMIMHIRTHSTVRSIFNFHCGERLLKCTDRYKYLGMIFNDHLDMTEMVKYVSQAANRSLGILISKMKAYGGMPFTIYTKLYDSLVQSVINYGAALWGTQEFNCINAVQNRALRFYLGVGNFTPSAAVNGDTGWQFSLQRQYICVTRLWSRLCLMSDDRLTKKVFLWAKTLSDAKVKNWIFKCERFFSENNLEMMLNMNNIPFNGYLYVSEKVFDMQTKKWINELERDNARRGEGGNKLRTYRTFKSSYTTEPYVQLLFPPRHRRAMAQFRAGVAPIRIETGRYERGRLQVHERVCLSCTNYIEDECHVILKCPLYDDIREELLCQCALISANFNTLSDNDKLGFILSHPSVPRIAARTLTKILERHQDKFLNKTY